MRSKWAVAGVLWAACMAAVAEPASEAAVRELLEVSQARQQLDGMNAQVDHFFNAGVKQGLQGRTPTPAQQQAIDRAGERVAAVLREQMAWERLEPMFLRIYQGSFTGEEVAGLVAFYKTPAGQAVLQKMPVLMQQTMAETQKMLLEAMPQLNQIQKEMAAELKAVSNK